MRRRPMQRSTLPSSLALVALASLIVMAASASASTLPSASYAISGTKGSNGWYLGSAGGQYVLVNWTISDPDNLVYRGCVSPEPVGGPTSGARGTCVVTLKDMSTISFPTELIKIDGNPPTGVAAQVSRGTDYDGWYNHPVGIVWSGQDATSGIASCSSQTYAGPDQAGITATGTCTDNAGNKASAGIALNYDATAPVLDKVRVDSRVSSDVVRWASTSPSDTVEVERWARGKGAQQATVFHGGGAAFTDRKVAPGLEYSYAVQTFDQAGNPSKRIVVAGLPKVLLLGKAGYVPRAAAKPILRWSRVAGARYYNVQLYRGSKRIFAAWPVKNQLGLPAAWRWDGKRQRLSPGKYRWYVWAGFGARALARYKTVGSAQFIVPG
jgi:hypothetical protein